ncbi:MAG: hypothetical protein Q9M43_01035 [Sulfurimonas sp.]|nr:hypothetical protein [Sulfurimonas sp.]
MASIDWTEYKEYKTHSPKEDRFEILIDFIKSYYNMSNPRDMFDMMRQDDVGQMLLERKDITNAEGLENFIYKS